MSERQEQLMILTLDGASFYKMDSQYRSVEITDPNGL